MKPLLLMFAALLGLVFPAVAQTLDPSFTPPASCYAPGGVYTMGPAQADGKRVLAGDFSSISGTATGSVVRLDAAGAIDQTFAQNIGLANNVYRIKGLPNGQYLLGAQGGDITAGGLVRTEVMRLNADGTGDPTFTGGTGPASGGYQTFGRDYAVQPDGKILVVGPFDTYSGVAASSVVRLNANGSVDTGFSVGAGPVNTTTSGGYPVDAVLAQPNGKILVGGSLTQFNGQPANGLVRLNANGSLDATFAPQLPANSQVLSMVSQPDGNILVSGYFGTSTSNRRLVRLLASGSLDPGFHLDSGLDKMVNYSEPPMAVQANGKITLIGVFYINGSNYNVARANADGSLDTTFQSNLTSTSDLKTVGVQPDGSVLVGAGSDQNLFGTTQATLARFGSTGIYNSSFPARAQVPGTVQAVARQNDGSLLVGGFFTEWDGQVVRHLVHLSSGGTFDAGYTTRLGLVTGPVMSLLVQPDTRVLMLSWSGLWRTEADGTRDASFTLPAYFTVYPAMALQPDGKLLIGAYGQGPTPGVYHYGLARLTTTGAIDPTFVRDATTIESQPRKADAIVVQPDGRIVVASNFFPKTGTGERTYVARYETTGALDPTFTPQQFTGSGTATHLYALAQQADGKLLIGGNFAQVGSLARGGVARLGTTGLPDNTFATGTTVNGPVYALAIQPNKRILLGGGFSATNATNALTSLARLLDTGQLDNSFATTGTPDGPVASLLVQPNGGIVLGGSFAAIYGQPSLGIARLTAANVLAVAAPGTTTAHLNVWPVPAHSQLHVAHDLSTQPRP